MEERDTEEREIEKRGGRTTASPLMAGHPRRRGASRGLAAAAGHPRRRGAIQPVVFNNVDVSISLSAFMADMVAAELLVHRNCGLRPTEQAPSIHLLRLKNVFLQNKKKER
jgi:hypothetical protein